MCFFGDKGFLKWCKAIIAFRGEIVPKGTHYIYLKNFIIFVFLKKIKIKFGKINDKRLLLFLLQFTSLRGKRKIPSSV